MRFSRGILNNSDAVAKHGSDYRVYRRSDCNAVKEDIGALYSVIGDGIHKSASDVYRRAHSRKSFHMLIYRT